MIDIYTPQSHAETAQDNSSIETLLMLLQEFQTLDPEFPLQYAICFLEIAMDEGLSHTKLKDKTGISLSTISRIIGALSDHRQRGEPFGLIEVSFIPGSRRTKQICLTNKGRAIFNRLELILEAHKNA